MARARSALSLRTRRRGDRRVGIAVELSTAGLRKPVGEIYPSRELCEMCIDAGAVFALSSTHAPDNVGYEYGRAVDLLASGSG